MVKKKMNKILVVEDIKKIESGEYNIEFSNQAELEINKNCIIHHYDINNHNLFIKLLENSNLIMNQASIIKKDMDYTFYLGENSDLTFNLLIINCGKNKVTLNVDMPNNNSKAKIKLRVINQNSDCNMDVICNGFIAEKTKDNELLEDLKGLILNNDSIKISPNMSVLTSEVLANHLVTIGPIREEDLFYLKSKGLSEKLARDLMKDAFIKNILSPELKEKIKMEVINIE